MTFDGPRSSIDLWSDEVLTDPFEAYAELRGLGSAVWLDRYDVVAVTRFAEVRQTLLNWKAFSSTAGVGIDPESNIALANTGTLGTDPPEHTALRRRTASEFSARHVDAQKERIRRIAETTIEPFLGGDEFDAVTGLSKPFVANVIAELLDLPDQMVADVPDKAATAFDLFGPTHDRRRAGMQAFQEIVGRAVELATSTDRPSPSNGSEDEIERIATYMFPGADTTVQAVSSALYCFARWPDQWALLRENPSLISSAISEVLRMHSPVRFFTRLSTTSVRVGSATIGPNTRVLVMYGCANRDERRFDDPEKFDVTRPTQQHLAFGHGPHRCEGANLAQLELTVLLEALLDRVPRIDMHEPPTWGTGFAIHGLERLHVTFARQPTKTRETQAPANPPNDGRQGQVSIG